MYFSLKIEKESVNEDILTAIIFDNGGEGIQDINNHFICSFGENVLKSDIITLFQEMFEIELTESNFTDIENENWMENWKKGFKPVEIGTHFIVKPTWETVETERYVIEIDAKMAFGTGTHETTQLAMEFLPEFVSKNTSVLDVGCGSGILAMAADRLGSTSITAFDIDDVAMENCYENIELNKCKHIHAFAGSIDSLSNEYDIVIANIISKILLILKDELILKTKKNAYLILSGILVSEQELIKNAFKELELVKFKIKGEWCSFVFKK